MPIYEYRCPDCGKKATLFFRSVAAAGDPVCPHCGSRQLDKLMSRVVLRRGSDASDRPDGNISDGFDTGWDGAAGSVMDAAGDDMFNDDADPRELARWTRQMSQQMGELDTDLDRALSDIERGADPDQALGRLDDSPLPDPGE